LSKNEFNNVNIYTQDMDYNFVTSTFKNEIKINVINTIFPNLNFDETDMLLDYLARTIETISTRFNFDLTNRQIYEHQFRENNYRDSIGLLYIMLPFIDPLADKTKVKFLNDLYTKKKQPIDINKGEPKYEFSNLEYGRCNRNNNIATEISFNNEHLRDNFVLLQETIDMISNKLLTNWINIRPISINQLPNLAVYRKTKDNFAKRKLKIQNPKLGLNMSDIYNTISNYLYHDVKNLKWIIYDIKVENVIMKFPFVLGKLLDISEITTKSWKEQNNKDKLKRQWKDIIEAFNIKNDINQVKNSDIRIIFRTLVQFFDKYYDNKADNYIQLPKTAELNEEEELEDKIKNTRDDDMIFKTGKSIKIDEMYEYIHQTFLEFKTTWYAKFQSDTSYFDSNRDITIKNIYNYAKSVVHYQEGDKYTTYPRLWRSLDVKEKENIVNRLNDNKNSMSWFNIGAYLKVYRGIPNIRIDQENLKILNKIRTILNDVIFEILVTNGVLTTFVPQQGLTDLALHSSDNKKRETDVLGLLAKQIRNNKDLDNGYHFLIGTKFGDLYVKDRNGAKIRYIDNLTPEGFGSWTLTYGVNWVSQIGFFHHYLNNRVIFVTGSTGVGKSTQVPKLFLYALKMIDYKKMGKIACTQPRKNATVANAKFIANELGIPIEEYNKSVETELSTKNYNIQYRHQEDSHELNLPSLILKFMTDGTLLQTLLENPLLKTKIKTEYTNKNIYDIVMIDEAHEHNKNMDIILTKMKYAAYFNNSLKLVIISATMDDDEPIYRRYYRDINDNRMYPFNTTIFGGLDRINVDRRFHISPPGETTQQKIVDKYVPGLQLKNIIEEILGTSQSGEILVFQPGSGEIMKTVKELNAITPQNVIALPYYKDMSEDERKFIEDIEKNIRKLVIKKDVEFKRGNYTKGSGPYTRAIIVATNIAEASITIPTLVYVVETGTQKTLIYNYNIRESILKLTPISESSRMQRRGRVGRKRSGIVYYLYNENTMVKNKKQYDICISDISNIMFDLLYDSPDDDPLITSNNDDNLSSESKKLQTMIQTQYYLQDKYITYQGNPNHYDYQNNKMTYIHYQTGVSETTINDNTGTFYIIHPEELNINRNILGTITNINPESEIIFQNNKIDSKKMNIFWSILEEKQYVIKRDNHIYKTEFGKRLSNVMSKFFNKLDIRYVLAYIYGVKYGCKNEIEKLIAMYQTIKSIKDIFYDHRVNGKYRLEFDKAYQRYKNCNGDSATLLEIGNKIIEFASQFNIEKTNERNEIVEAKAKFLVSVGTDNLKGINTLYLKKFIKLYNTNKLELSGNLTSDEYQKLRIKNKMPKIDDIKLNQWAESNLLNARRVLIFYNNYLAITREIKKYEKQKQKLEEHIPNQNPNPITGRCYLIPLIHAFSNNIFKVLARTKNNNYFIGLFNPSPEIVFVVPKVFVGANQNDTILSDYCLSEIVLSINKDEENLYLVENIPSGFVSKILPYQINEYNLDVNDQKEYYQAYLDTLSRNKEKAELYLNRYIKTINEIRQELLNNRPYQVSTSQMTFKTNPNKITNRYTKHMVKALSQTKKSAQIL